MAEDSIEQEPGRVQKVAKYREFRRAQKTAEKALGNISLEDALSGVAEPSALIKEKDHLEQAAGSIKRDLQGRKERPQR